MRLACWYLWLLEIGCQMRPVSWQDGHLTIDQLVATPYGVLDAMDKYGPDWRVIGVEP